MIKLIRCYLVNIVSILVVALNILIKREDYSHSKSLPGFRAKQKNETALCSGSLKKVLKTAVGRNQIRRRVYEAIRLEFNPNLKLDCIFVIYSKDFTKMDFDQIRAMVSDLLEKAKTE